MKFQISGLGEYGFTKDTTYLHPTIGGSLGSASNGLVVSGGAIKLGGVVSNATYVKTLGDGSLGNELILESGEDSLSYGKGELVVGGIDVRMRAFDADGTTVKGELIAGGDGIHGIGPFRFAGSPGWAGLSYDTPLPNLSSNTLIYKGAVDASILLAVPSQTGNSGKVLGTNGTATSWVVPSGTSLPSQTKNGLANLSTDGSYGTPTPVWRQPPGMAKILPGQDIKFFGTSLTAGIGVVATTNLYAAIVADQLGCTYTMYGVSGSQWFTAVQNAFTNIGVTNSNPSFAEDGFNELRAAGNTSKTLETIKSGARAFLSNQFLGTAIAANNGAVTTSGTWATQSLASSKSVRGLSGLIRVAKTSGATLTWAFTGETLVIGAYSTDEVTSHGGDFTYAVDGGSAITYTGKNKATGVPDGPGNKMTLIPNAVVVKNLGSGSHTVVVTTNSTDSVRIDYFGTLKNPAICAPVIMSAVPKMNTAGYAITGNVSDAIMETGTATVFSVVDEFIDWPVYKVDPNNLYNVSTDVYTDNIHQTALGHQHFAQVNLMAIESGVANGGPNPVISDNASGNKLYASNGGGGGAIAQNRNPATGVFDNTGAGAAQLQLITGNGFGRVDVLTSHANNTVPTITTSFDLNGQIVNTAAGNTAKTYLTQTSGASNFTWNYNPALGTFDDTGSPGAMIAMGGASGTTEIDFFTSPTNNTALVQKAKIDKSGNFNAVGSISAGTSLATGAQSLLETATIIGASLPSLKIQNTTTNARTLAYIAPNGSSVLADFWLFSSSDVTTNYSTYATGYEAGSGFWALNSLKGGTATLHPIYFNATGGASSATANIQFQTSGNTNILNSAFIGGTSAPTAKLHIAAGTAMASTASLKIDAGTLLSTTEAGTIENDGTHLYYSPTNAGTRFQLDQQSSSSTLFNYFADVQSVSTTETDLYTNAIPANTLATNGDKIKAEYSATLVMTGGATKDVRIYFAGTKIYDSSTLTVGVASVTYPFDITIIRDGSSSVRCQVNASAVPGTNQTQYTKITGLTFSSTNILKITGQSGAGAATGDVTANMGYVTFISH